MGAFEGVFFTFSSSLLLGTGTLLGQQHRLDVGQDTTLGNGHTSQELVQFLIIPESIRSEVCKEGQKLPDGKLKMPGDDARLLVVSSSVASQLQDLSSQILHHCCHVDWSTSSNPLGIIALPMQHVMNP